MTNRVLFGKFGDGVTYGMRISKPGYDVLSAGTENMIFDTGSDYGRILYRGTAVVSAGSSGLSTTVSLPANLSSGAAPVVLFRWVEFSVDAQYALELYMNQENGWTVYCSNTTVSITRNFAYSSDTYVAIFVLTMRATS